MEIVAVMMVEAGNVITGSHWSSNGRSIDPGTTQSGWAAGNKDPGIMRQLAIYYLILSCQGNIMADTSHLAFIYSHLTVQQTELITFCKTNQFVIMETLPG